MYYEEKEFTVTAEENTGESINCSIELYNYNQFAGEKTHGFNHVDESPLFFILTVDIYLTYIYKCGTIYL